ncbi:hypothetical protein WICPIJ_004665, partial [Wickerhamomyces pijperi]
QRLFAKDLCERRCGELVSAELVASSPVSDQRSGHEQFQGERFVVGQLVCFQLVQPCRFYWLGAFLVVQAVLQRRPQLSIRRSKVRSFAG